MGSDVHINYDDMNQILNEEEREEREEEREGREEEREGREESSSSSDDDDDNNNGGGGEEDVPVPQVLIALKRGRRSTSGSGFVVNVRGN